MPGDIRSKERSIITLTSSGASLSNGSAGSAATDLDLRSGGNAANDLQCRLELTCQWATITGIVAGTVVAELYLVPKLDGTNLPDIDTTAGSSRLPAGTFVASFDATKAPVANTNARYITPVIDAFPALYTAYVLNRSGQTVSANWSLKVVSAQGQYT
jgi:hypothetical protein